MTLQSFNFSAPIADADGHASHAFRVWMTAVGEAAAQALALAQAAVPGERRVIAAGGLQVGGALASDVGVAFYKIKTTVAQLPATTTAAGDWAWALDGRKPGEGAGAGTGVPCFWSNGAWIAVTSGAAVTA